mmetsp:Transcript_16394/g.42341  ORF Transcript_16394/g.42341 Transcript_16394/m.42341 type:complete len:302 (-) Transcript_16394:49-954(-)
MAFVDVVQAARLTPAVASLPVGVHGRSATLSPPLAACWSRLGLLNARAGAAAAAFAGVFAARAVRQQARCLPGSRRWTVFLGGSHRVYNCVRHAGPAAGAAKYINLVITSEDGGKMQVELKDQDTVKVLKAMINMDLGVPEELQDLTFSGTLLDEDTKIADCGLKEGSAVLLKVRENEDEVQDDAPAVTTIDGEVCCRITVKCEMGVGKAKRISLDVPMTDSILEVKQKAYDEFILANESIRDLPINDYGLFLLKSDQADENGQLRWLRRDERMKEKKTVDENGLLGGEELVFASLFWYEG